MIELIKRVFGLGKLRDSDFLICHYPENGFYLVKHKGYFLKKHYPTGHPVHCEYDVFAKQFDNESDARKFIDKFKELYNDNGVRYLKYK